MRMILFFGDSTDQIFAVKCSSLLSTSDIEKLSWLFAERPLIEAETISGEFFGPRATMITPWSTNAVEITQNMGLEGIERIETYIAKDLVKNADPMLVTSFITLKQDLFDVDILPRRNPTN